MASKLQVPSNIDDPTVLRRFLTSLTTNINSNALLSGTDSEVANSIIYLLSNSGGSTNFWDTVTNVDNLRNTILNYVQGNLETNIIKNTKDISLIAEQFGTFYEQALAASWYGLTVKAGGAVAGLEIGSLDPDVTTPDDESSYFRVIADNFIVGRAYEDLSQEEKDYLESNDLPNFGTVYNSATKAPVPAIVVSWNNTQNLYEIFFNGIVNFNNVNTGYTDINGNTVINGGQIETNSITADKIEVTDLSSINANLGTITSGLIYDSSWTGGNNYKMKIDLNSGSIYIK